jgi:hypothetical protein
MFAPDGSSSEETSTQAILMNNRIGGIYGLLAMDFSYGA